MARKKVIDLNTDSTMGFEKPGQHVEGYYIGHKVVKTKFGTSKLHVLLTEAGSMGVWGSAQLDDKLARIPAGAMAFITYEKKIKVKNGTMKVFDVEFDDELTQDVSNVAINFEQSSEPEADEEEEQQEETAAADEEAQDVDPEEEDEAEEGEEKNPIKQFGSKKPAPAVVNDAQKNKALELLNKQRRKTA